MYVCIYILIFLLFLQCLPFYVILLFFSFVFICLPFLIIWNHLYSPCFWFVSFLNPHLGLTLISPHFASLFSFYSICDPLLQDAFCAQIDRQTKRSNTEQIDWVQFLENFWTNTHEIEDLVPEDELKANHGHGFRKPLYSAFIPSTRSTIHRLRIPPTIRTSFIASASMELSHLLYSAFSWPWQIISSTRSTIHREEYQPQSEHACFSFHGSSPIFISQLSAGHVNSSPAQASFIGAFRGCEKIPPTIRNMLFTSASMGAWLGQSQCQWFRASKP